MNGPSVAIIGAGAAGTLTAAHLLGDAALSGRAMDIVIIDPRASTGPGVAYSTPDEQHRLNVPADRMSAYPGDPGHFLRWLRKHRNPKTQSHDFAARRDYGNYLNDVLDEATRAAASRVRVTRRHARVVGLRPSGPAAAHLQLDSGGTLAADVVVLAGGPPPPGTNWAPESLRRSARFVPDPWRQHALIHLDDQRPVLLVGTGLTMVDVALSLERPGRILHAVSRHGWLPHSHADVSLAPFPVGNLPESGLRLPELRQLVRTQVAASMRAHGDWRPAIDGLRCVASELWQAMPTEDRREFLARDARRWEVRRHRMAPSVSGQIERCQAEGRLLVRAGEIVAATDSVGGLSVRLRDGSIIQAGWVVNCTGPRLEPETEHDPLVDGLLRAGHARPGALGIGLDTSSTGQVRNAAGQGQPWLWTLGASRRGQLWESTAIPEIRAQAAGISAGIMAGFCLAQSARVPQPGYDDGRAPMAVSVG